MEKIFLLVFWVKLVLPELFALNYGCVLVKEVTIKDSLSWKKNKKQNKKKQKKKTTNPGSYHVLDTF